MKEFKIYTCGRMGGISYEEQIRWRKEVEREILLRTDKKVVFIHPPLYYAYGEEYHKSEREVMDWELMQVCNCDIVVFNLDGIMPSIGSHMELGAAYGARLAFGKNISIIGIGKVNENIHPWIGACQFRNEETIEDAAEFIAKYLLI